MLSGFLGTLIKIVMAVVLLPLVIASAGSLYKHLGTYPSVPEEFFFWGASGFLFIFLFLHQFWGLFDLGQKIMSGALKFLSPFETMSARFIPFYVTVTFVLFYVATHVLDSHALDHHFLFFGGFAFSMHILLVAQEMQQQEHTPVKPAYLFWMCLIFIINIFIVVLLFDLVYDRFTFPDYFLAMLEKAKELYSMVLLKVAK